LLPLAAGHRAAPVTSYFEALSSSLNRGWAPLTGLARDRLKLIDLPIPELYDLDADPHEMRNLAAAQAPAMETIRAQLARIREGDHGVARAEESAETREQLRSLGYASAAAPAKRTYMD